MRPLITGTCFAALAALALCTESRADTVLDAYSRGYYNQTGLVGNNSGFAVSNYASGVFSGDVTQRSYIAFDLTAVSGHFSGAVAYLDDPLVVGNPGVFNFYAVAYDSNLVAGTGFLAAYNAIGSGTLVGSATITASGPVSVTFNADGLSAIEAAEGGDFVLGVSPTNSTGINAAFLLTSGPSAVTSLTLTTSVPVPEPTSLVVLGFSVFGLGALRRKRSSK